MIVSKLWLPGQGTTLGIDDPTPMLAWQVTSTTAGDAPTAYEVQVGTTDGGNDVLATGKVADTAQTLELRKTLAAGTTYFWRVRVWDNTDTASGWGTSTFETGIWSRADWRGARWISRPGSAAPQLRTGFTTTGTPVKARLYVAVGGYADVAVNGTTVSTPLAPGFTDYRDRVQYSTYDVTPQIIADGANAIGITLGRGFYGCTTVTDWNWHLAQWNADPTCQVLLKITYSGGEQVVVSNESWKVAASPTTADSAYLGETYDARNETAGWTDPGFDASSWAAATVVAGPAGPPVAQCQQPITRHTELSPTSVEDRGGGVWRYTFGKVIAGWGKFTITAAAGTEITIQYAEKLNTNGTLFLTNTAVQGVQQTDKFIAAGGTQTWEPRFSYKGFRYIDVAGVQPDAVKAVPVYTDMPDKSVWSSSSALLNQMAGMAAQSVRINTHGMITDTPMYERNGWLGDVNVMCESILLHFDAHAVLKKWLTDMADAVRPDGSMTSIVPSADWGLDEAPDWTSAFILVAHKLWRHTGDTSLIAQHFHFMQRHVDHWMTYPTTVANIYPRGFGDWASPAGNGNEGGKELSGSMFVMLQAAAFADICTALGRTDLVPIYTAKVNDIKTAVNARLLDTPTGVYKPALAWAGEVRQTPTVLAVKHGVAPNPALSAASIEENVRVTKDNHLSGGVLGNEHLLAVLCDHGYVNTALAVALKTDYPSWGQWAAGAATTTWNAFGNSQAQRSLSHHMHGTYLAWLYQYLAGIKVTGPASVTIKPYIPTSGLTWVQATVETMRGPITSRWEGGELTVTVPPGLTATYAGSTLPSGTNTITL